MHDRGARVGARSMASESYTKHRAEMERGRAGATCDTVRCMRRRCARQIPPHRPHPSGYADTACHATRLVVSRATWRAACQLWCEPPGVLHGVSHVACCMPHAKPAHRWHPRRPTPCCCRGCPRPPRAPKRLREACLAPLIVRALSCARCGTVCVRSRARICVGCVHTARLRGH